MRAYPSSGGLSIYLRDVTGRRRQEEQARQLAAIVESSDDAVIGKTLDGEIVTWNEGARRMYGYAAEEAIGRPISMLAPSSHRTEMDEILERIRHGEPVMRLETVRMRKDGSLFSVSVTVSPVFDEQGRVRGASTIARDITERKRLEEKVREAQKLESLGVLAGGVAHDFNNLLTGILGNASLAVELLPADHAARDSLASVIQRRRARRRPDAADAGLRRQGPLRPAPGGRFRAGRRDRRPRPEFHPAQRAARPAPGGRAAAVDADSRQFRQLVMNLVINGAEAVGEKAGTVVIATSARSLDEADVRARFPGHELAPGAYVASR